ncbi:MAG TPA: DUF2284 domain-containing protein [Spirochaetales bacterium]|nr:DUF2284 domain-containing protein [Spirochaetales bacterium]HRY53372.1 DUF2284 domain-containing protein [Spirochaetia bacterium]HRZ65236.1 DUF2284 domain-containing protein [Spirochaetia bacterium]
MGRLEEEVEALRAKALSLGAGRAEPLAAEAVRLDPRVGLKCRIPLCSHYGRSFMCPPLCPSPEQFAAGLARYRMGLLVQAPVLRASGGGSEPLASGDPATGSERGNAMRESMRGFSALMTSLEREALGLGYSFALALAGGTCALCEECAALVPGAACRHPFEARPSMEAVGIDVAATAKAAGVELRFPAAEPSWTGLLLVE